MNNKARFVTICLLAIAASLVAARRALRSGELAIDIRRGTGKENAPDGKALYSVAGKLVGQTDGANSTTMVRRLVTAISLARTQDNSSSSRIVNIVTDADLTYPDLRTALTAVAQCGQRKLTLATTARATNRKPGGREAKPTTFTLWTPPRPAASRLRPPLTETARVSVDLTVGQSGGPPIVTYSIPVLLKKSASEIELWKGLRALNASIPDGTGLLVLPTDSVPSGAVVKTVTKATEAGFRKIGFLEVQERHGDANAPLPGDTTTDANTDSWRIAQAQSRAADGGLPTSHPSSAPAATTTKPALTPEPAKPLADANTVIFVVDRSGSVAPVFQEEIHYQLSLIGQLKPTQKFHVIVFSEGHLMQAPRLYPVDADDKAKAVATKFLRELTASGATIALPALQRAERMFRYANAPKGSKMVVLLSDGDFEGISGGSTYKPRDGRALKGNDAILQWLRDHNKDGLFRLHTISTGTSEEGREILKAIASENGGKYWDMPQPK